MTRIQNDLFQILDALPAQTVVLSGPDGVSMTGAELADRVKNLSETLQTLPQGTRVATLLPDAPATAISLLAMVHHVQVMPLNPALSDVELLATLNSADAQILLAAPDDMRAERLADKANLPNAQLIDENTLALPAIDAEARDAGLILLTSGSTGVPKRVPLRPAQLHQSAKRIARALELGPQDRAVHALPMFHIGAIVDLMLAPLIAGGAVHIAGGMGARALQDAVLTHGGTWLQLVPTMLARLQTDLSTREGQELGAALRFIRSVSSDLAPSTQEAAEAFFSGTPIIQMYGMTETAGQITTNPLPPMVRKLGSVGRAIDIDLRIEDGEIQVRGDAVMHGYEGTARAEHFTKDDWLRTGDLGYLDEDGFLFLTGRAKEIINRGGEKISPHEVEHAALSYAGVVEAAAFARPHASLGQEVGLAVTLDEAASLERLEAQLQDSLAAFKVPRKIQVLEPLPRLGSGKIDRRALAALRDEETHETPQAPQSKLSAQVAQAWRAVLPDTPEGKPDATSDFFDAGGDSLAGAQFLFEVERRCARTLPTNLLYDAPEFGDFVEAVANAPHREIADQTDPKHAFLQSRLKEWDAPEVERVPFMRVLHHDAPNDPLFWCAQEEGEYQQLAAAFANKRPLYLMRSLFLMLGKNDDMNRELALDYAKAIDQIQPSGALCLGGFCEGAKIMQFAAEHLIAMGREVRVVISWDQWFTAPLAVPVLHLWSDDRYEKYQRTHLFPERAIAPAHPAGFDVIRVGGAHTQVLTQGPLKPFMPKIETALMRGIENQQNSLPPVFDRPVSGEIRANKGRFFKHGEVISLTVTIANTGSENWRAARDAPLYVTAQIKNLDGHIAQSVAAKQEILEPIQAGETREVKLEFRAPKKFIPIKLSFDISDSASLYASSNGLKSRSKVLLPNPF